MGGETVLEHAIYTLSHISPILIYGLVLFILLLESSGVPILNTTLLLFTGALASMGHLNIWLLGLTAISGSVAGACLAYGIGARGGRNLFFRLAALLHIEREKMNMTERWFHRSGVWMVFLSRVTPYIRPFSCFPAGITHMPFPRFFISVLSGSILWCIGILYVGWMLGRRWGLALAFVRHYTIPTLIAIILLIALGYTASSVGKRIFRAKLQATQPHSTVQDDAITNGRDLLEV